MAEYLTYPFKTMRITQSYNGTTSHKPHTTGTPKDWPIDEGGLDSGRDPIYATVDIVIKKIYGVGNSGVNTMWIESVEPVKFANGKTDYFCAQLTHPNDSDLRRLKAGQIIKKGGMICYEGTDGASGNHIHMSVGMGHMTGTGWTKNTKGKWVLTTTNGTLKPEEAFYIDPKFTTIKDAKKLAFKNLPSPPTAGTYRVTSESGLNIRTGTTADVIAKGAPTRGVLGYNTRVAVTKVKVGADGNYWGRIGTGWICLKYCERV